MTVPEEENPAKGAGIAFLALLVVVAVAWFQLVKPFLVEHGLIDPSSPETVATAEAPPPPVSSVTTFSQCDQRWAGMRYGDNNMCANGCGPTAIATAITILTGKEVTPRQTADYALASKQYVDGQGSSSNLAPVVGGNWGLKAVPVSRNEADIRKALSDGAVIYVGGKGPVPFTPPPGHILLIRALNKDGTVMIGNSVMPETNKRPWKLGEILPYTIYAHALYRA